MARPEPTLLALLALSLLGAARAADPPKPAPEPVELVGKATGYYHTRNWSSYYWREDFSFVLHDEKSGQDWRILSREPTPAYDWRLGTTYPGLKVDWDARPRVKVLGITGVDRQPATFYDFKLNEPHIATAFVVWVETKPDEWHEFYVNNWFHKWGAKVDPAVYQLYAGKQEPYDVYGYLNGQVAPFSKKAQALIDQHRRARMFHGLIKATKDNPFGYEIELLHLFGPDAQGNGTVFYGEPTKLVPLDKKPPK